MTSLNMSPVRVEQGNGGSSATVVTFSVNALAAVRSQFKLNLEIACLQAGVAYDFVEQRRFLKSITYLVTLEGEAGRLMPIIEQLEGIA